MATKLGLSGSSRAALQLVVGVGAFVAGDLAAPTMAGAGVSTPPQVVDCTGAFDGPDLTNPLQTGVGLSSQGAIASGAFSLDIDVTSVGAGIGNAVVVASGSFTPANLSVVSLAAGVSVQGAFSSGGLTEWDGGSLDVTSAGTGEVTGLPDAVCTGAWVAGNLATPVQVGTGTAPPPQVVDATGAFTPGDLATPVFDGTAASQPSGAVSAQGAFAGGSLAITADGDGTAVQPQVVAGSGAFAADNLQITADGSGTITGILGTGTFAKDLSVVSLANGLAFQAPNYDLGWEDDDVTWGGLQLTSKDFAPVSITGTEFFILGQATDSTLDCLLERKAIVYEQGSVVLGTIVQPDIDGPEGSAIQISLGSHKVPDGAIDWEGPYDYVIGTDTYADFAVSGKYLAVKFESADIAIWTLPSYSIEYEIIGKH